MGKKKGTIIPLENQFKDRLKGQDLSKHFRADIAKERNVIGTKIAEARKKEDLTQAELSKLLTFFGISVQPPAINKWERGETVPNAYQLMAVCHALNIDGGLDYFTGPVIQKKDILNTEGRRLLKEYREFLESKDRYTVQYKLTMIEMPVSQLPASAGYGDYLDDEYFKMQEFPASSVPEGAQFAVPVDGDSMEPLYHDRQLVWIQKCAALNVGDVGLFTIDGHGYIKTYDEREPEKSDYDSYLDSDGVLHPQVVLISQNQKYQPKLITPDMHFRIIGRVLN